ncbi:MAG TPA: glycosyltransferase family A protein [Candidatus Methylomirabilis sp.]|nr:glycosyltransferase family A protein [Candidatus Methylomirabilis sp.]
MSPKLAVVIIGRNEGERLMRCIDSVRAIRWSGGAEIIYVDSGSRDGSPARASARGVRVIALAADRPTAARGRNAGWRASSGEFVLFLDGDTILAPGFVEQALPQFANPRVAVVWGERRELHPESSIYNRVLDLDWIYPPGLTEFCGGDALMRRTALEEVGGYDDGLIAGEEPEMCRRMRARGCLIMHVAVPMTGHDLAMTRCSQYWRRARRSGHAYLEVSERFRGSGMPFWEDEVRRNRWRAAVLLTVPLLGGGVALALRSAWPCVAVPVFYAALIVRTAHRFRWKGGSLGTRLLYGIHSHAQQIPILIGQMSYLRDRRAGRKRGLIEYKGAGS